MGNEDNGIPPSASHSSWDPSSRNHHCSHQASMKEASSTVSNATNADFQRRGFLNENGDAACTQTLLSVLHRKVGNGKKLSAATKGRRVCLPPPLHEGTPGRRWRMRSTSEASCRYAYRSTTASGGPPSPGPRRWIATAVAAAAAVAPAASPPGWADAAEQAEAAGFALKKMGAIVQIDIFCKISGTHRGRGCAGSGPPAWAWPWRFPPRPGCRARCGAATCTCQAAGPRLAQMTGGGRGDDRPNPHICMHSPRVKS